MNKNVQVILDIEANGFIAEATQIFTVGLSCIHPTDHKPFKYIFIDDVWLDFNIHLKNDLDIKIDITNNLPLGFYKKARFRIFNLSYLASYLQFFKNTDNTSKFTIIGHNILDYDIPLLKKLLGIDLFKYANVIDTLLYSRLVNINHTSHSMDDLLVPFNAEKEVIEDYYTMGMDKILRVAKDVMYNELIYLDLLQRSNMSYERIREIAKGFTIDLMG